MAEITENELHLISQLGYSLYREGQYEKAIIFFEGLAELQPQKPEIHAALALLYHLTEQPEAALKEGLEAYKSNRTDVPLLMTLGEIYLTLQEKENARDLLNRAYTEARATGHPATNRILLLLRNNS